MSHPSNNPTSPEIADSPATTPNHGEKAELEQKIPSVEDSEKQAHSQVINNGHRDEIGNEKVYVDAAAEKRLLRKMDRRILPLLWTLYMLSYLDRSNIGNAKIAGMSTDLHFSKNGNDYTWLLTIFYIAYALFEWCALMWKLLPPHIWASLMVFGWGLSATLQSTTTSWSGMMVLRFFLGAFEAGFSPGVPYYLSFFYMRRELGLRIGLQLSAGPLATCFAGALAYGVTSNTSKDPRIANWKLLFLVEGLPTILMVPVAWYFLPDSPLKARFLNEEDRAVARARGIRQVGGGEMGGVGRTKYIVWPDVGAALLDMKNYLQAMMYFSCNVSFSSLPVFLPTILTEMGFTPIHAQGLSAPPYFIAFIVVLASTFIADRTGQRGITIAILSFIGAIGYIILAATAHTATRYFGVYLAAAGIYPTIINIIPWVLNNQGSDTKRGLGIAILNTVGQCGPLLGTRVFPATDSPRYRLGLWTCAAFMLFSGFLAIALRRLLVWENKRLDTKFGKIELGVDGDATAAGIENDGPKFRYIL